MFACRRPNDTCNCVFTDGDSEIEDTSFGTKGGNASCKAEFVRHEGFGAVIY